MNKIFLKNGMIFIIILLVLGLGFSSTIAVEDNNNSNNKKINRNNYTFAIKNGDIYENTDCFVKGDIGDMNLGNVNFYIPPFVIGDVGFGGEVVDIQFILTGSGWIYTDGAQGQWTYEGWFDGMLGIYQIPWPANTNYILDVFIGIEGFRGIYFGYIYELIFSFLDWNIVGYADSVKIITHELNN
jgi:hypothetical protein